VHGQVRAEQRRGGGGVEKYDNRYIRDPAPTWPTTALDDLLAGFIRSSKAAGCCWRPGGLAVSPPGPGGTTASWVDLPAAVLAAGRRRGLVPGRAVRRADLAGLRGGKLIPRPSFLPAR